MIEERKFAILFAATILVARKLIDIDPNKPNRAKQFYVDHPIDDAAFILERIDKKWPTEESGVPYPLGGCQVKVPPSIAYGRSKFL